MFVEAKVFQIHDIGENLHKKFIELESQVTLSTPLEVLEERTKSTIDATKRI